MNSVISSFCLFFICLQLSSAVNFRDCSSAHDGQLANLTAVEVDPCVGNPRGCKLTKGTKPKIMITFTPKEAIHNATSVVHGIISGVPIPFAVPVTDACSSDQGLTCPLLPNQSYTFVTSLPIKEIYPNIKVIIQWQIKDPSDQTIICMRIKAAITN